MLLPKPLSAAEQDEVAGWLRPEEAPLYWAQHVADQRHGLTTARKVAARAPGDRELIRAGLLHDIGKSGRPPSAWGPLAGSLVSPRTGPGSAQVATACTLRPARVKRV